MKKIELLSEKLNDLNTALVVVEELVKDMQCDYFSIGSPSTPEWSHLNRLSKCSMQMRNLFNGSLRSVEALKELNIGEKHGSE